MTLYINGKPIEAQPGKTLRELIVQLGMDSDKMAKRPLAAKIAGEVFNLNYVPVREKDADADRPSIRRAMAASNGQVRLLSYSDTAGKEVYTRTAQFVIFLALHRLWPEAKAKMNCTLGSALYIAVTECEDFSATVLKEEMQRIVEADIPLVRHRVSTEQAMDFFRNNGQSDKARLLSWRKYPHFDQYGYEDYCDYFYGELAPSTSYLRVWDVFPNEGGFIFAFPNATNPDKVARYQEMPRYFRVFSEGERWGQLMECETVADLNEMVDNGKIRELIRVNEALHEKRYSKVADEICKRNAQAVMLAGPSSSGKTTSANRLATQLRVHGKKPILMSLDDYYIDRDEIEPGPDGKIDFEHINTIDTKLFGEHLQMLLNGQEVEIPSFNFKLGKREWRGHRMRLQADSVIIVEGLHALNPVLLPEGLAANRVFRLYVSPLLPLNLDDHNRIPTSYLRLLRRIVRDYESRGTSVQRTMEMWGSVQRGEKKWIFPFQENADMFFNSSTLYELAVLKKHIFPLLTTVEPEDEYYDEVRAIVKVLDFVQEADVDDEIPPTSLVREFIGGNTFYR